MEEASLEEEEGVEEEEGGEEEAAVAAADAVAAASARASRRSFRLNSRCSRSKRSVLCSIHFYSFFLILFFSL